MSILMPRIRPRLAQLTVRSGNCGTRTRLDEMLRASWAADFEAEVKCGVRRLLPDVAVVEVRTIRDYLSDLSPEEFDFVRNAVRSRHLEFSTGRTCAHAAMKRLGVAWEPLLRLPDRSPDWPPEVVGSISHSHGICICAAAPAREVRSIGIDIEKIVDVDSAMFSLICSPEELELAATLPKRLADIYVTLLFSAKEALYKSDRTVRTSRLGFRDVQIKTFGQVAGSSQMRADFIRQNSVSDVPHSSAIGRWQICGNYVITVFHS